MQLAVLCLAAGRIREGIEWGERAAAGGSAPAQLEICDGRRLRAAGQLRAAIGQLRAARKRLITLGARPYLQACDRELTAAGAPAGAAPAPALPGLTPAEQAVARLVAAGRSRAAPIGRLHVRVVDPDQLRFVICWTACCGSARATARKRSRCPA